MHIDEFKSLKEILFINCQLNYKYFAKILPQLEVVKLDCCSFNDDFDSLTYCDKLKEIHIIEGNNGSELLKQWLSREFASLESVHFITYKTFEITNLRSFLERNSTIQTSSTSQNCL